MTRPKCITDRDFGITMAMRALSNVLERHGLGSDMDYIDACSGILAVLVQHGADRTGVLALLAARMDTVKAVEDPDADTHHN